MPFSYFWNILPRLIKYGFRINNYVQTLLISYPLQFSKANLNLQVLKHLPVTKM